MSNLLTAPATTATEHPSWCDHRICYLSPVTGFWVHAYEPPSVEIDGATLTLTVFRRDTAEGPGETLAVIESTGPGGTIETTGTWT